MYNDSDLPLVADSSFVMTKLIDLGGMDDDVDTDEEQEVCGKRKLLDELRKAIEIFNLEGGAASTKKDSLVRNFSYGK